jgi:hypothetical protein
MRRVFTIGFCLAACISTSLAQVPVPSLHGRWVGVAEITTCSVPGGSAKVTLELDDKGYNPAPHDKDSLSTGNVSGQLEIDGSAKGIVALNYEPDSSLFKSALGANSHWPSGSLFSQSSPYSEYWVTLKPGDPWLGVGFLQTLTGTLSRRDSRCFALQDAAVVLHVTLRKQ